MANLELYTTINAIKQEIHRIEGKLKLINMVIRDIKHVPNDTSSIQGLIKVYTDKQLNWTNEQALLENELARLNKMKVR